MHIGFGLRTLVLSQAGGVPPAASIILSATAIAETASIGDLVGVLSVSHGTGAYAFTIIADPDGKFALDAGDDARLELDATLDFETATSHTVMISADNGVDTPLEQEFTIFVSNVVETAPSQFAGGDWSVTDLGTNGDVRLAIASLPSAGDGPITDIEYQIDGGSWVSLASATTGNYDLSGLTDGTSIAVAVRALNAAGSGAASVSKPVTPTGIPDAFGASDWSIMAGDTEANVTISTLPNSHGAALTLIEYRIDAGTWTDAGVTTATTFNITGLTNTIEVTIDLRATNANGAGTDGDDKPVTPVAASYDAASIAYFAAMSVAPDDTRKGLLDAMITGLKADGVWAKLAGGWLSVAGHDAQATRLNIINPAQVASAVNSPTFTTDRGYRGDGATSYLETSVSAQTLLGTGLGLGTFGYWFNIAPSGPNSSCIGAGTPYIRIDLGTAGTGYARMLCTNNVSITSTHGHKTIVKTAAGAVSTYGGGVPDSSGTALGDKVAWNAGIQFLKGPTAEGYYSDTRMAAGYFTAGILSATEVANIHARLNTYLTAIGAN